VEHRGPPAKGLSGFLSDMIAKTGGSQEKMASCSATSGRSAARSPSVPRAGKELTDELGQFQNVAGVTSDVLGVQKQGLAFKAAQAEQKFNALATTLGQRAIPALASFLYVVDRTQIPLEELEKAAANGTYGAISQFRNLQDAAQQLGMTVEDTYALMGEAGTMNVEDLKRWRLVQSDELDHAERAYHDLAHAAKKDFAAVGDAAGDAGDETATALQKVIDEANAAEKALNTLADEALSDYFDPIIAHDRLLAGEAEVTAQRRILASKTATAAEKRDATSALHQLDKDNTQLRIKLFQAGKLSKKEQGQLLKDLKEDWKHATGAAKTEIAGLIAEIERLQQSSGVSITVGKSGGKKKRAGGGPVAMGDAYLVGEEGPELFVPTGSGSIIPHGATKAALSGGGGAPGPLGELHVHVHGAPLTPAMTEDFVRQAGPGLADYLKRRGFVTR
jgi:hypothetical protein